MALEITRETWTNGERVGVTLTDGTRRSVLLVAWGSSRLFAYHGISPIEIPNSDIVKVVSFDR